MSIEILEEERVFHLKTRASSYMFYVGAGGHALHLYWGPPLRQAAPSQLVQYAGKAFSPDTLKEQAGFSLDTAPQEYPAFGTSDFRQPSCEFVYSDGSSASEFVFDSFRIVEGKPRLEGLPATYAEAGDDVQTLEVKLVDEVRGLAVYLSYSVFADLGAITRSVRYENKSSDKIRVKRAMSVSVDFPQSDYEMLQLSGAWADERNAERRVLTRGTQSIESRRGASSHQHNPFIALLSRGADEQTGEVYGFSLVYSGNFLASVEVDQFHTARVIAGINPFDFEWLLEPGASFQCPEAVMVYSGQGIGGMSRIYHRLYRERLCRGAYRDAVRPVLINNWEATYFDFDEAKIVSIANSAREAGIELFVLDDGWFGTRNDDRSSLGDWFVNRTKLPNGIEGLAGGVTEQGLKFGLWVEPEMISPDSMLYRAHPDWCLHIDGRRRTEARNQLVLDLSRQDVCRYIADTIAALLESAPISYVKWDMNRHMTEVGSAAQESGRQRETAHRYMLGLYGILEEITGRFPGVLFESCSGGGGRFDPGMLHYMPQTWTSDNTDAVSRLRIQYGTSIVYPLSAMGAHVSAVPNHQVGRSTSLELRGLVAMSGNFGYELDLSALSDTDKEMVARQIETYKAIRPLVQSGEFYRLISPFDENGAAWMVVSGDRREAVVFYFKVLAMPNEPLKRVKLQGLDRSFDYVCQATGERFGGDVLMHAGLKAPYRSGDFAGCMWRLNAVQERSGMEG